jgi:hypothetical protein
MKCSSTKQRLSWRIKKEKVPPSRSEKRFATSRTTTSPTRTRHGGDGEILVDYRCSPGTPVDRYRSGYKTYILISRREVKNKGNVDEFNVEWGIRQGFLRHTEQ